MKSKNLDGRILRWERRLLRFGTTERADYIVHILNLLRRRKAAADQQDGGES